MNIRFLIIAPLIAGSTIFAGCSSDNSAFETPATGGDTPENAGLVSQTNFTIGSSDPFPAVFDPATGFKEVSVDITVKIGDLNNQLLTDEHTVFFKTEWGLIDPSCTTKNGKCSVIWQTSNSTEIPTDLLNTIVAWTVGEEGFTDTNGNGKFDDADTTFNDLEEPYLDAVLLDGAFNPAVGDKIIDVVNGNDSTGENEVHDIGDTFLNSPNCTHSSLCSSIQSTTFIWNVTELNMAGPQTPTP